MEAILKVTPQQLISTADEFSTIGNQVRELTTAMMEKMTNLAGIYESEEASAYIAKANGLQDDIAKLNAMLEYVIPLYVKEGKSQLTIAFGCMSNATTRPLSPTVFERNSVS